MNFDRWFTRTINGSTCYVGVSTRKTQLYRDAGRVGFEDSVEFSEKPHRGSVVDGYPVVFDDFTTSDGSVLSPIDWKDVPAPTKRRFTKWLNLQ
jgi:hypothetical protein